MSLTWYQLVHNLNAGRAYGDTISLDFLRKICEKGELTDTSVHLILELYLTSHPVSVKAELIRNLIRNPNLTLEAKVEALGYFFFRIGSMKKGDSKKRSLAIEVLNLCKESPRQRLKIMAMVEEIRLKGMSRLADQGERPKINVISLEAKSLTGISTKDYSKYGANHFLEPKKIMTEKPIGTLDKRIALTSEQLTQFFNSSSTSAKTLKSTIAGILKNPWGADLDSIIWNLQNLGNFDRERFSIDVDVVEKFILDYFECHYFLSRLTSKPLLNSDLNLSNYPLWRTRYGLSFLLSERSFVPREFGNLYNTFQEFASKVNPSDMFLRKTFGLRYQLMNGQVGSFLYFVKTPKLKKGNAGKFLVVIFYGRKMNKKLMTFLGLQDIQTYLNAHVSLRKPSRFKISNCYVKECKTAESAIDTLALLQLEVPFQFCDSPYNSLTQIEVFYPASEFRKRKEFLEFLSKKKSIIMRARNRVSDIHCINCNQPLTDRVSRIRGYGPECWRKLKHLSITTLDMSSSSDVFERYATQDFEDWLIHVESIVRDMHGN